MMKVIGVRRTTQFRRFVWILGAVWVVGARLVWADLCMLTPDGRQLIESIDSLEHSPEKQASPANSPDEAWRWTIATFSLGQDRGEANESNNGDGDFRVHGRFDDPLMFLDEAERAEWELWWQEMEALLKHESVWADSGLVADPIPPVAIYEIGFQAMSVPEFAEDHFGRGARGAGQGGRSFNVSLIGQMAVPRGRAESYTSRVHKIGEQYFLDWPWSMREGTNMFFWVIGPPALVFFSVLGMTVVNRPTSR